MVMLALFGIFALDRFLTCREKPNGSVPFEQLDMLLGYHFSLFRLRVWCWRKRRTRRTFIAISFRV